MGELFDPSVTYNELVSKIQEIKDRLSNIEWDINDLKTDVNYLLDTTRDT